MAFCGAPLRHRGGSVTGHWAKVTCDDCRGKRPKPHPFDQVHYQAPSGTGQTCDQSGPSSLDWDAVTCPACKHKRPWVPRETSQWELLLETLEGRWPERWAIEQDDGVWSVEGGNNKTYSADSFAGLIKEITEPELIPCPFCGCSAGVTANYVGCGNNGCEADPRIHIDGITQEDAVAAWNKRAAL